MSSTPDVLRVHILMHLSEPSLKLVFFSAKAGSTAVRFFGLDVGIKPGHHALLRIGDEHRYVFGPPDTLGAR